MRDEDSDTDEGFIPNKIQIKPSRKGSKPINQVKRKVERPVDFQSRYIFGQCTIRKQPTILLGASQCQSTLLSGHQIKKEKEVLQKKKIKQKILTEHPYSKYFMNIEYKLIYSRSKIKTIDENDPYFCKNQIKLGCLNTYDESSFLLMRDFDQNFNNQDDNLEFDSRFESGNLLFAFKHNNQPYEYTLLIQNDTNTYGYNQWFYFSVKKGIPNIKYKFNIVNFRKKHSFFKQGKKIAIYSLLDNKKDPTTNGWIYGGNNITYTRSPISVQSESKIPFYSLSFQFIFHNKNDCILMALNMPYSYSKLIHKLETLQKKAHNIGIKWTREPIAHTLANNAVPYLTIASQKVQAKRLIIFLARQHPGETWSSFLMEQILNTLVSQSPEAKWLLQNFVIKIFPMINVDGVIYGNSRCDIGGFDLNRKWKNPSKLLHPQIFNIKEQIQKLSRCYTIESCFDIHGHSKQYNVFTYSCKNDNTSCRVFPLILSKLNDAFNFQSCTFGVSRCKQKTARATIFNIINTFNVHTIQCSFFGTKNNSTKEQFHTITIRKLSESLLESLKVYFNHQVLRKHCEQLVNKKINQFIEVQKQNKNKDAGSESDPSADQMSIEEKMGKLIPARLFELYEDQKMPKIVPPKKKNINFKHKFQTVQKMERIPITKIDNERQPDYKEQSLINKRSLGTYNANQFFYSRRKKPHNLTVYRPANEIPTLSLKISINSSIIPNQHSSETEQSNYIKAETQIKNKMKNTYLKVSNVKFQERQRSLKSSSVSSMFDELPMLCILSEKQKVNQLQRLKERIQFNQSLYKTKKLLIKRQQKTQKNQSIQKKKVQKSKDQKNFQYVGQTWKDNFNRYSKEMSFFYGTKF